jgi:hypothetical protein
MQLIRRLPKPDYNLFVNFLKVKQIYNFIKNNFDEIKRHKENEGFEYHFHSIDNFEEWIATHNDERGVLENSFSWEACGNLEQLMEECSDEWKNLYDKIYETKKKKE